MADAPMRPTPHIVVCMKVVPRPEEVRVDAATGHLDRAAARSQINPPDLNALEAALQIKAARGGCVSILSMGPPFVVPLLAWGVRMGADHIYLLSDRRFAGSDTLATTYILGQAIRKLAPVDLVLCGEESSDGATGQVPSGLAQWLEIPQITYVQRMTVGRDQVRAVREVEDGHQVVDAAFPVVISLKTGANEPRFPDFARAVSEPEHVSIWSADDLAVDGALIGQAGSPTAVGGTRASPAVLRKREFLQGSPQEVARVLVHTLRERLAARREGILHDDADP